MLPASSSESSSQAGKRDKNYYQQIGKMGGTLVKARYGEAHFSVIGKKGGATTKARYGRAHYQSMGKRGGGTKHHKD